MSIRRALKAVGLCHALTATAWAVGTSFATADIWVDANAARITTLSDAFWGYAELGFQDNGPRKS